MRDASDVRAGYITKTPRETNNNRNPNAQKWEQLQQKLRFVGAVLCVFKIRANIEQCMHATPPFGVLPTRLLSNCSRDQLIPVRWRPSAHWSKSERSSKKRMPLVPGSGTVTV